MTVGSGRLSGSPRPSSSLSGVTFNRTTGDGVSVSNPYWYHNFEYDLRLESSVQELEPTAEMTFHLLPYDLLLNVASYLAYNDIRCLQLTCKSLYYTYTTRPVYRKLAIDLLRRCRPLPLKGFQRIGDLETDKLIYSVAKAQRYERAWMMRGPKPGGSNNNYLDADTSHPLPGPLSDAIPKSTWYKIISAPPNEQVDWLSPITSNYTLCATKSGKVVCWDVQRDCLLAEWDPRDLHQGQGSEGDGGERWELWKCRVEFEDKKVYFTMARVLFGSYDDTRIMEFSLMCLQFYENCLGQNISSLSTPKFSSVALFKTSGVVMNIFLLEPQRRLLSAFTWIASSNTIGLYVLFDWEAKGEEYEYMFIDTGIECVMSSNWSCILFNENVVIHCEDADAAFQHFYPLVLLETYKQRLHKTADSGTSAATACTPILSGRLPPFESIMKRFIFPAPKPHMVIDDERRIVTAVDENDVSPASPTTTTAGIASSSTGDDTVTVTSSSTPTATPTPPLPTAIHPDIPTQGENLNPPPLQNQNINPYPFPPWYPESAHFVRQWWPILPSPNPPSAADASPLTGSGSDTNTIPNASGGNGIPRVSCTVVLLAAHDTVTHKTRFVIAQHYFRVPMRGRWRIANTIPPVSSWTTAEPVVGDVDGNATAGLGFGFEGDRERDMDREEDLRWVGLAERGAERVNAESNGTPMSTDTNGIAGAVGLPPMEMYLLDGPPEGSIAAPYAYGHGRTVPSSKGKGKGRGDDLCTTAAEADNFGCTDLDSDYDAMKLWYVSDPFEVVCLEDSPAPDEDEDGDGAQERPRPLVAVDFGHAVWIEWFDPEDLIPSPDSDAEREKDLEEKGWRREDESEVNHEKLEPRSPRHNDNEEEDTELAVETEGHLDLGVQVEAETDVDDSRSTVRDGHEGVSASGATSSGSNAPLQAEEHPPHPKGHKRLRFVTFPPFNDDGRVNVNIGGAQASTLEIPPELDLHSVETINIDQSQGAIILSVKQGKIFILCYE